MKAERARLARLRRLERIRAIARRTALAEAGKAEGTLAQLEALGSRTRTLAGEYAARTDPADGAALGHLRRFVEGLDRIVVATTADTARARDEADARAAEAAAAEQRRAAAEERVVEQARVVARKVAERAVPTGARKTWHGS